MYSAYGHQLTLEGSTMNANTIVRRMLVGSLLIASTGIPRAAWAQCVAPACTKIIDNGPDAAKKNLVVMGDGYAQADQTKYDTDVDTLLVNGVFAHDFFSEDQNGFNVYRLNLVSVDSGVSQRVYDEHGTPTDASDDTIISTMIKDTALKFIWSGSWAHCWLEGSPETGMLVQNALNASVPGYDYVVVILNQDSYGGCGGGGFQIVPRGVTWDVLAHEYGHGVGGLGDEYSVGGAYTGGPVNGINCTTFLDRDEVFWRRFIDPATPFYGSLIASVFGPGMESNRTVTVFEGCGTRSTGIYRPVNNCRMRTNSPPYCPVCYTWMKKALYPFVAHDFEHAVVGDFDGDGRSDVLLHNGQDVAIYRASPSSYSLSLVWIANNIVPASASGITWQPAAHDQFFVGDFDGDGKDDVFVFNGTDWAIPYLGLLRSDGTGLQGVARYDGFIPGFWIMRDADRFFVGDFDGDGKDDLFIFNGASWAFPYIGMLRATGTALSGVQRYDGILPGWGMRANDKQFVGDFDGDGKADFYVFNGNDWSTRYLGMVRSTGTALTNVKLFSGSLPGWVMSATDQLLVGDFDGDRNADLYVFNAGSWFGANLAMERSTGADLGLVKAYNGLFASVPGWKLRKGDRFFVADANRDGLADLFVWNPAVDWTTEHLGTLLSTTSALSGSWSADWVGGWNLGAGDRLLVANYEGGRGRADIFIRNKNWFGLLRRADTGLVMDHIYFHWIYAPLYDARPWSDSMP